MNLESNIFVYHVTSSSDEKTKKSELHWLEHLESKDKKWTFVVCYWKRQKIQLVKIVFNLKFKIDFVAREIVNVCNLNKSFFPEFSSAELFRKQELDLFKFSTINSLSFTIEWFFFDRWKCNESDTVWKS